MWGPGRGLAGGAERPSPEAIGHKGRRDPLPPSPNLNQILFWPIITSLAIFDWPVVCVVRCVEDIRV